MILYIVTAYRWGQRDNHSYVVSAHTDLDAAKKSAEAEMDDRGGKYGCEVVELDTDWPTDGRYGANCAKYRPSQVFFVESPYFGKAGTGSTPANMLGTHEELIERYKAIAKEHNPIADDGTKT